MGNGGNAMRGRDIRRLRWLMAMQIAVSLARAVEVDSQKLDFDKDVAPLLAGRCIECHSGAEAKGKLDLTRAEKAVAGGESGIAIVAGKPDSSSLWQRIEANEMPP